MGYFGKLLFMYGGFGLLKERLVVIFVVFMLYWFNFDVNLVSGI